MDLPENDRASQNTIITHTIDIHAKPVAPVIDGGHLYDRTRRQGRCTYRLGDTVTPKFFQKI